MRELRLRHPSTHRSRSWARETQEPYPGARARLYGEKARSGLAAATVKKMHVVLRKALAQAVSDGLVPRNAADGVKPPRVSAPGEEIKQLDSEECAAFLEASRGEKLEALYVLASLNG